MGDQAQVLLVGRRAFLGAVLASAMLAACRSKNGGAEQTVLAEDYDAFFLWAGVKPPAWLKRARTVYALAGEVRHQPGSRFVGLRAVPRVSGTRLWLTVRVERLDWDEGLYRAVLREVDRWAAAGNALAGLQIDFDAATRGLDGYAEFLADLRGRLPSQWKLSITGLMDWSAGGDPQALARLAGIVDEIVVQTYQGRHTIPGYETYLASLQRLGMPYRIALVEGGAWRAPEGLESDPNFKGYVVFLL
ncbi:DUF3142 domain-containing protein [Novosphingobium indicum]|nr:DUF3142 domain-containing protein [Novosphingobium indicum]